MYVKTSGNNDDSYLFFDLEQLFYCHLFVLGDPLGSVHASEAPATAVLVEEDVIKPDLHERRSRRRHLIMMLSSNSASEVDQRTGRNLSTHCVPKVLTKVSGDLFALIVCDECPWQVSAQHL